MACICGVLKNIPKRDVPIYSLFTIIIIACLVHGEWLAAISLAALLIGIYHIRKWSKDDACCSKCGTRESSGSNTGNRSNNIPVQSRDRRQVRSSSSMESNVNTNTTANNPSYQSNRLTNSVPRHQNATMEDYPQPYTTVSPRDLEDLPYYSSVYSVSGQIDSDRSPQGAPLPPDLLSVVRSPSQHLLNLSVGSQFDLPPSYSEIVDTSQTCLTIGPPYQSPSTSILEVDESNEISEAPPPSYSVATSNDYSESSQPGSPSLSATNPTPKATTGSTAIMDESTTDTSSSVSSTGFQSQTISGAQEETRDEVFILSSVNSPSSNL